MKFLAAADIHGKPAHLERLGRLAREHDVMALLLAGDVGSHFGGETDAFLKSLSAMPAPVVAVRGNTDPKRRAAAWRGTPNVTLLDLTETRIGPVRIVGVSGTVPLPFASRVAWREEAVLRKLAPMVDDSTVLLVHTPPRGARDRVLGLFHAGSRGLAEMVSQRRPALVVCGHIHEQAGTGFLQGTMVLNASLAREKGGALLDMGSDGSIRVNLL